MQKNNKIFISDQESADVLEIIKILEKYKNNWEKIVNIFRVLFSHIQNVDLVMEFWHSINCVLYLEGFMIDFDPLGRPVLVSLYDENNKEKLLTKKEEQKFKQIMGQLPTQQKSHGEDCIPPSAIIDENKTETE